MAELDALRAVAVAADLDEEDRDRRAEVRPKQQVEDLPPLIKGYLRLGGFVGDGAVIDRQFNTTDVCVIVQTDLVTKKYYRHFDRTASRNL